MKAPHLRTAVLLAAAALAVAGCEDAPARHARVTQDCVLVPGMEAPDVAIGIESAVRVILPGPKQGSGLVWEIASNNSRVLEQTGALKAGPGPGPTTSATFYSLKPGKSVLRFVLVRPDVSEAVPAAMCEVTVRVSDD
jgi:hypothetical protein